jgi:hypothetical protein
MILIINITLKEHSKKHVYNTHAMVMEKLPENNGGSNV